MRDSRTARTSLTTARVLPPARRRAWIRQLAEFHVDELNGLQDRLCSLRRAGAEHAAFEPTKTRVARARRATGWMGRALRDEVRGLAAASSPTEDDFFGVAALLLPSEEDGSEADRELGLHRASAKVRASLREVGLLRRAARARTATVR